MNKKDKKSKLKTKNLKELKKLLGDPELIIVEEDDADDAEIKISEHFLKMLQECRKRAKKRKIRYIS